MGKFKSELRSHSHSPCSESTPISFPSRVSRWGDGFRSQPWYTTSPEAVPVPFMCTGPGRWCGALSSSEGELGSWREPREPVAPGSLTKDVPAVGDMGVPPPLESGRPRRAPSLEKASGHRPRRTIPAAAGKGVPPYLCGEQPGQVDLWQDFLPVALPVGLLVFHGLIRGENLARYRT